MVLHLKDFWTGILNKLNKYILNPLTLGNSLLSRGFCIFVHELILTIGCHINHTQIYVFRNLKGN